MDYQRHADSYDSLAAQLLMKSVLDYVKVG